MKLFRVIQFLISLSYFILQITTQVDLKKDLFGFTLFSNRNFKNLLSLISKIDVYTQKC